MAHQINSDFNYSELLQLVSKISQYAKTLRTKNITLEKEKLVHDSNIIRYDCNEILKIAIDINSKIADIQLYHDLIHDKLERISVNQEISNFIDNRFHQTPAEIFNQLEINNPNLTQK
ncbi:hypothetical protein RhiirA4_462027 [Rhizophagus irregularis]|uniref:Uncharacterized protein n=1 Tax=Rhizophagus irregularis TaxID=588596 RepID=A0A2I1GK51_9GLOM|nr:hypothetical protein RhiirA4_462027 [Rhizophagus irregularis]